MKKLTFSSMAAARLRANKRQYLSLVLGIFLSIFLISSFVLGSFAIYQRTLQNRYDKVGHLDMVVLDNDLLSDEAVLDLGDFDRLGHAYVSGCVTGKNVYLGYYDEMGSTLLDLVPIEGRMPEDAGEIAVEASAMEVLEAQWSLGETVELSVTPLDGMAETRQFTLVGILPERSVYLEKTDHVGVGQFPAIVTSAVEPSFATGRIAFHYMMGIKPDCDLGTAMTHFWDKYLRPELVSAMYGLSISGQQVQIYNSGEMFNVEAEMFQLIIMAGVLAAALILSCGVGISGAMEGVLSKRREEIGVLRALGATRRQIRRMFGRENLILALVVSPVSIGISTAAVWLLSVLMPESLKFAFSIWLILPIGLFSVTVILLSGYLPLVQASKLMPMSVIRDTAVLRRSKGVKSKKDFSAVKLIASRQIRFYPTRQIGAALLVGLMILCSGLFVGLLTSFLTSFGLTDYPGFYLENGTIQFKSYIQSYLTEPMSQESIRQIRSLDNVRSVGIDRELPVLVQLDSVPRYAVISWLYSQYGMLSEELFQEAMDLQDEHDAIYTDLYEGARSAYLKLRKDYDFSGEIFRISIVTLELNGENLDMLKQYLTEGSIDVEAINAGEQVLVYAPSIWQKNLESGGYLQSTSEEYMETDTRPGKVELVAWNDCFYAGQTLPLTQLYNSDNSGTVSRNDALVTVGGVCSDVDDDILNIWNDTAIITTEEGLANLGLRMEGLRQIDVYVEEDITLDEEETLEQQLTAISRRSEGYTVVNVLEEFRKGEQENQQIILLFAAVITVFFAVAVSMIVSSVTRQLHAEGRTIGMLRAVGADEKAILGCYSGQVNAAILGGLGIGVSVAVGYLTLLVAETSANGYNFLTGQNLLTWGIVVGIMCVMAAVCWTICRAILRLRVREIVSKSIIENIREL